MTMIIRNNKVYAGSGGGSGNANIVKVTQAEYDALPESKNSDGVLYAITDGESQSAGEDADMVIYTEEDGSKTTVQDKLSELNSNLTSNDNTKFRFATDGEGNYGYLKADDSFVPFKRGGNFRIYGRLCGPNYNGSGAEGRIFIDVSNISKMFITNITRSGGHNWGAYGYYPDGTEEKFIANADGNITNKEYDVSKYFELKIYSVGSTSGAQGWNWIDYDISFS